MGFTAILLFIFLITLLGYGYHYVYALKPKAEKSENRLGKLAKYNQGKTADFLLDKASSFRESQLEKRLNSYLKQDVFGYGYVRLKLMRMGIKHTLDKLVGIFFAIWGICFVIVSLVLSKDLQAHFFYSLGISLVVSHYIISHYESKRKKLILTQLSPALEIILRGVRAGSQIDKTFQIVAREMHSPLKEEFIQMNSEIDFGADFDKVLHASAVRVDIPDYYFFITTLVIQRQTGGSLADVLENIIATLSKSKELRMKIKVFSSEAKTSGYVLAALPLVIMGVLSQIKPDQVDFLLHDPFGKKLLVIAISMVITALFIINKMIKLDI